MATPAVSVAEADSILTVTFERDEKLNALSPEMTETLAEAVEQVGSRADLRALVIQARGRYFTAGVDLRAPSPATTAGTGSEFRRLYRRYHHLYDEIEALEKPVALAAQGPCLGAGLEMASSCDFRFASTAATFRLPEVSLGTIAGSGGVSRLTTLVGPHWAKWIAMADRTVDAERALMIGLVHEVFPVEGFHERVHDVMREIASLPPEAVAASKLAIQMVTEVGRATARDVERLANTHLVFGPEFAEANRAFLERPPR